MAFFCCTSLDYRTLEGTERQTIDTRSSSGAPLKLRGLKLKMSYEEGWWNQNWSHKDSFSIAENFPHNFSGVAPRNGFALAETLSSSSWDICFHTRWTILGNSSKRDIHLHKTLLYWTVFSKLWYLIKEQRKISLRCNKFRENMSLTFEGFKDDDNLLLMSL